MNGAGIEKYSRLDRFIVFLVATAVAVAASCSSAPRYPACNRDDQCAVSGKHDYCVDGKCVYCRTSSDCADRERCRQGKCESDPDAPPIRALDAGDDATDSASEEDAGEPEETDDESDRRPQRQILPRGVRRFLRP